MYTSGCNVFRSVTAASVAPNTVLIGAAQYPVHFQDPVPAAEVPVSDSVSVTEHGVE